MPPPHAFPHACPAGAGVRGDQPNAGDRVDMLRGVYCLLHIGLAVRATTKNVAGENQRRGSPKSEKEKKKNKGLRENVAEDRSGVGGHQLAFPAETPSTSFPRVSVSPLSLHRSFSHPVVARLILSRRRTPSRLVLRFSLCSAVPDD